MDYAVKKRLQAGMLLLFVLGVAFWFVNFTASMAFFMGVLFVLVYYLRVHVPRFSFRVGWPLRALVMATALSAFAFGIPDFFLEPIVLAPIILFFMFLALLSMPY